MFNFHFLKFDGTLAKECWKFKMHVSMQYDSITPMKEELIDFIICDSYTVMISIINLNNASMIISVQTSEKPWSSEPQIFLLASSH